MYTYAYIDHPSLDPNLPFPPPPFPTHNTPQGFIDCDNISARCMLTIFQLFAVRSEASVLRMCEVRGP